MVSKPGTRRQNKLANRAKKYQREQVYKEYRKTWCTTGDLDRSVKAMVKELIQIKKHKEEKE